MKSSQKFLTAFIFVAAASIAGPAMALPKSGTNVSCTCGCNAPNGYQGYFQTWNTYTIPGTSCAPIIGKTCNIENPISHIIQTGAIIDCDPGQPASQSQAPFTPCPSCGKTIPFGSPSRRPG
jgi:hypothetical protein